MSDDEKNEIFNHFGAHMDRDFMAAAPINGQQSPHGAYGTVGRFAPSVDWIRGLGLDDVVVVVVVRMMVTSGVVIAALRRQDLMMAEGVIWHGQRGQLLDRCTALLRRHSVVVFGGTRRCHERHWFVQDEEILWMKGRSTVEKCLVLFACWKSLGGCTHAAQRTEMSR